jgi:hypothetical protein
MLFLKPPYATVFFVLDFIVAYSTSYFGPNRWPSSGKFFVIQSCCKLSFVHQTCNITYKTHTQKHSYIVTLTKSTLEFWSSSCGRKNHSISKSRYRASLLGPLTRFYLVLLSFDNCVILLSMRPL